MQLGPFVGLLTAGTRGCLQHSYLRLLGPYFSYWVALPSLNTWEVLSLQLDTPCFIDPQRKLAPSWMESEEEGFGGEVGG